MPFSKWKRIPVLWSWWHFAGPQTPSHTKVSATRPQNPQGLRRMAVPRRGRRPPSRQARRVTRPEANDFLHSSWGNNKFQQPWSVLIFWTPKLTKGYLTEFDPCPVRALHLRTSFARQRAADSSQATLLPGIQAFSARKPSIDTAPIFRRDKAKSQRPTVLLRLESSLAAANGFWI